MVTWLEVLNRARARQGSTPISIIAIGNNSGDSLQGIAALNAAVSTFYDNSYDLDATDKVATILTTASTSLLTPPVDTWDTNVIKAVKYQKTGETALTPLTLIDLQQAEDYKLQTFGSNDPQFWYVNQSNVYVLPVPTIGYTMRIFYQAMYPDITVDNVIDTIVLPSSALKTLVDLVYARLREQIGDPQWIQLQQLAEQQVVKFYNRNKHTYKSQGKRVFKVTPRAWDRRL